MGMRLPKSHCHPASSPPRQLISSCSLTLSPGTLAYARLEPLPTVALSVCRPCPNKATKQLPSMSWSPSGLASLSHGGLLYTSQRQRKRPVIRS